MKKKKTAKRQPKTSTLSEVIDGIPQRTHIDGQRIFTPDELERISLLAGFGLNVDKISAVFKVSKRTFYRILKATPFGHGTLLKGRAEAEESVSQTAFQMAVSGKFPVMTIFWLKCRARWQAEPPLLSAPAASSGPGLVMDLSGKHLPDQQTTPAEDAEVIASEPVAAATDKP